MIENQNWVPCDKPKLGDTLKWVEPLWAEPTKPRGKRDQIGEQEITAELLSRSDLLEFKVVDVQHISGENSTLTIKRDSVITRKKTSIEKGNCHKLVAE